MQWDDSVNAGFTTGTPWIKVNSNYPKVNAKQEVSDPDSVFSYYKKLIRLRHENEIIVYGDYELLARRMRHYLSIPECSGRSG